MKQLSGLDASFLYMETASQFGHVSSLSIYERPDDPDYDPLVAWRDQIERRLHLLEPLRRRLRDVPFNLDHPFWVDDPDFDLDFHVRHTAVPPPGERRAARRAGGPDHRPPARPEPAAVGELRHRGPARRPLRHPHQGPPRHHRRRRRAPSCSTLMLDGDPRATRSPPPDGRLAARARCPATAR